VSPKIKALRQLWLNFVEAELPVKQQAPVAAPIVELIVPSVPAGEIKMEKTFSANLAGHDAELESQSRVWLTALGLHEGAEKLAVLWMPRMRSTAGYARWPDWRVELNPRLVEFEGQVERTLKHELAHLIAYARANKRRIAPHGAEWRRACADLGIPDESVRHTLPLPRSRQKRNFAYVCPSCGAVVERVRKFSRPTACSHCCRKHSRGRFDSRFQFVLKRK
jgi:SprT protein